MFDSVISPVTFDDLDTDLPAVLERFVESDPSVGLAILRAMGPTASQALDGLADRLIQAIETDKRIEAEIDETVERASAAQKAFEGWPDEQVDSLLRSVAEALADRAEALAWATVDETGRGNVLDKTVKNRFASLGTYQSLVNEKAEGILGFDAARKVTELASPVGVVFAVVPLTNPVATAIFKTLIALKGRNALILSFPNRASGVGQLTGRIIRDVLEEHSAPVDLVQWARPFGGRRTTAKLMSHSGVSLVLATGSAGLVKAAYSSGTPAIGVGPGNAPAWICHDAELDRAARSVVVSKSFDNGLICGAEHNLVVDEPVVAPFTEALVSHGAAILTAEEAGRFKKAAIDPRHQTLRSDLLGRPASTIAARAGIHRAYAVRLLVIPANISELEGPYAAEKLAPVLSMFTVSSEEQGMTLCKALLHRMGMGHTAIIHTSSPARAERFGREMPASRIIVNSPGAQGCCGMTTGLANSMTLGCGTFGGNSTTENVTYRHLLNIKRIAYHLD
jgi:acyl-CoA reductase-like NAD-dependent aldehyde dehydrogenase